MEILGSTATVCNVPDQVGAATRATRMQEAPTVDGRPVAILQGRVRQPVRIEMFSGGVKIAEGVTQGDGEGLSISSLAVPTGTPLVAPVTQPAAQPPLPAPVVTHYADLPPAPPVAPPKPRQRVTLVARAMGKVTLFCQGVAISPSMVVLCYPNDGETTIVEPPLCTSEDPLQVDHGGQSYRCLSGGWSVEMDGQYLVLLPRLQEPTL